MTYISGCLIFYVGQCDPGWIQYKKSCYEFKFDYNSWHEAEADCRKRDSHLVSIGSKVENDFVTSQVLTVTSLSIASITSVFTMVWTVELCPQHVDGVVDHD